MFTILALGCGPVDLVLEDAQNYSFDSDLTVERVTIAARSDATVDWSALTVDMLGQQLDPASEISEIQLTRFGQLSFEELAAKMDPAPDADGFCDGLRQADVSGYVDLVPSGGQTSALLSEFAFIGTPMDPTEEMDPDVSYLMSFSTDGVSGYRTLIHPDPDPDSDDTLIEVTSDATLVDYTVDLQSLARIPTKSRRSGYVVDWTGLTTDMGGCELQLSDVTTLRLAYYELSLEEIAADFLRLEFLASEIYDADVEGLPSYDLAELWEGGGRPFEGFRGRDGTWLLALICDHESCTNPAPLFLGVLEVGSES